VAAGIDSIEHCSWLGEADGFDFDEAVADRMARQGTFVVPTLSVIVERYGHEPAVMARRAAHLRAMIAAGVVLVAGSDAGTRDVPFGRPWREIQLLAAAGLTPLEAIQAATSRAAACLGIADRVGSVAPGKTADLIAVAGNPLEDLAALQAVKLVIKEGRVVHDRRESAGHS
jgi:imidazolonepropionase-like amidohydrolase